MRFGKTLREAVYGPWKDEYMDYGKLKALLHEDKVDDEGAAAWSEEDENRFCDEIFNTQLEKVARFQQRRVDALKQRVDAAMATLRGLAPAEEEDDDGNKGNAADDDKDNGNKGNAADDDTDNGNKGNAADGDNDNGNKGNANDDDGNGNNGNAADGDDEQPAAAAAAGLGDGAAARLRELERELDDITNEVRELKKYSSINYTGFLKIVKKHDRKRGDRYRVRPMMQLSLAQRPFNSEQGYSPLLNKLSLMYFAIRQQLEGGGGGGGGQAPLDLESQGETHRGERYTAHKFWVHPDNLLEVKTLILRWLPALVYSEQSAKELDGKDSPAVTSLYLDSRKFDLYSEKVDRQSEASSLRLRWYGQLSGRPDIFVEHKTADASGNSRERKFATKDKWIKPFLDGDDVTEKAAQKMERQGVAAEQIDGYRATVAEMQAFIGQKRLSPVMRANYVRTAFQRPADDRVRIAIDTDLAFVREDTLDGDRPCRDPGDWHRLDIDGSNMAYPFRNINQSEVSKFPYAVLQIKLKEDGNRKRPSWVEDLMASHLVHPAPRFSKFVHGVASLFEDYVNNLPFWLSDLETDIRRDPRRAFEEEEQRRAQRADDVQAVGSLIGATATTTTRGSSYKAALSSPVGESYLAERMAADARASLSRSLGMLAAGEERGESSSSAAARQQQQQQRTAAAALGGGHGHGGGGHGGGGHGYGTLSSVLPGLSLSKYARARRAQRARLPEGVVKPTQWIKNTGEVKIEPKVWLANERTFLKWQHIGVLQGGLALGLYTAAAAGGGDAVAEATGAGLVAIAAFAAGWGYWMLRARRAMILERSGKDFDNLWGPMVVSGALMAALVLNFFFQYRSFLARVGGGAARVEDGMAEGAELR